VLAVSIPKTECLLVGAGGKRKALIPEILAWGKKLRTEGIVRLEGSAGSSDERDWSLDKRGSRRS